MFALTITSCHTSKKITPVIVIEKYNVPSLNGKWQLKMLFASENAWTKPPFININLKEKTFVGNSSCNSISGRFTVIDSYVGFDKNIISTKMACTNNYEEGFFICSFKDK
ncbi:MAG: META domain-containing protein [Chitinophagaceae bacterium]